MKRGKGREKKTREQKGKKKGTEATPNSHFWLHHWIQRTFAKIFAAAAEPMRPFPGVLRDGSWLSWLLYDDRCLLLLITRLRCHLHRLHRLLKLRLLLRLIVASSKVRIHRVHFLLCDPSAYTRNYSLKD